jgi:hypothetical protein
VPPVKQSPPRPKPYVARMALMRAHGDLMAGPGKRRVGNWLASAAVYCGAAVAGAAWIGGALFDVREAASAALDRAAAHAGFAADIIVEGVEGPRADQIRAAALPEGRIALTAAAPEEVRARLKGLDWVENAVVQRHWPRALRLVVTRKPAAAAADARAIRVGA